MDWSEGVLSKIVPISFLDHRRGRPQWTALMQDLPQEVADFAEEAERFVAWVEGNGAAGASVGREALVRITKLFAAALELPEMCPDNSEDDDPAAPEPVSQDIRRRLAELPVSCYLEIFDPLELEHQEEPVIGSLRDDVLDIYMDVRQGLALYRAGRGADAVWHWRFNFAIHWGEHATDAMRVLYWWVRKNDGL